MADTLPTPDPVEAVVTQPEPTPAPTPDPTPAPAVPIIEDTQLDAALERVLTKMFPQQPATPEPTFTPDPYATPTALSPQDIMSLADMRAELEDMAMAEFPDGPPEMQREIKQAVRGFRDPQSIQNAKAQNWPKQIAEGVAMKYVRAGKYVPENLRQTAAPRPEPTGANPPRPASVEPSLSIGLRAESYEVFDVLGLSEDELDPKVFEEATGIKVSGRKVTREDLAKAGLA